MTSQKNPMCTSFAGSRMIASGNLFDVAMQTKLCLDAGEKDTILVFDDETSKVIEIDFRGEIESFKNRLNQQSISAQPLTVRKGPDFPTNPTTCPIPDRERQCTHRTNAAPG